MRLNFWQWLGVALLIVGGGVWIYHHTSKPAGDNPTTLPATLPTTAPKSS